MRVFQPETPLRLAIDVSGIGMNDEIFYRLCRDNPELGFELTSAGELVIVTPVGSKSGHRESQLIYFLVEWARQNGAGLVFSSSAGFTLPNGAKRLPDAAWIQRTRWEALSETEQEAYAPLCPDFVVEIRSRTDRIADLKAKMAEYTANGARLCWLLDPFDRRAWIYRRGRDPEELPEPKVLDGEDVLPGFRFEFSEIP